MYFVNEVAYKTSKSKEEILIKGFYEVTDKVLNGRVKCVSSDNEVVWVEKDTLNNIDETLEHLNSLPSPEPIVEETPKVLNSKESSSDNIVHIVLRGETLESIARKYNVPLKSIVFNGKIFPGATVVISKR